MPTVLAAEAAEVQVLDQTTVYLRHRTPKINHQPTARREPVGGRGFGPDWDWEGLQDGTCSQLGVSANAPTIGSDHKLPLAGSAVLLTQDQHQHNPVLVQTTGLLRRQTTAEKVRRPAQHVEVQAMVVRESAEGQHWFGSSSFEDRRVRVLSGVQHTTHFLTAATTAIERQLPRHHDNGRILLLPLKAEVIALRAPQRPR